MMFNRLKDIIRPDNTMRVTVLGSSGVGKTSLLTAMYAQLENTIARADLQFLPDPATTHILHQQLVKLRQNIEDDTKYVPERLLGNTDKRTFRFGVGRRGKKAELNLEFIDYPGGWLHQQPEQIQKIVRESHVVLVVIDVAALMQEKGQWHEYVNTPLLIKNTFQHAYQELTDERMVLFVPVKCETYIKEENTVYKMHEEIKKKYKQILDLFSSDALCHYIVSAITPVQTVGCLIFSRIDPAKDERGEPYPIFYFAKGKLSDEYRPQDAEQPLRYLLAFLLQKHLRGRISWFPKDKALLKAINEFTIGIKHDVPFELLQGRDLLG